MCGKKTLENPPLILFNDADPIVTHHQFGASLLFSDDDLYLPLVRGVFNGIFYEAVNGFLQWIEGHADSRCRFEAPDDLDPAVGELGFKGL